MNLYIYFAVKVILFLINRHKNGECCNKFHRFPDGIAELNITDDVFGSTRLVFRDHAHSSAISTSCCSTLHMLGSSEMCG